MESAPTAPVPSTLLGGTAQCRGEDRTRWELTALGNWSRAYLGAAEKDTRTHNAQNEIVLRYLNGNPRTVVHPREDPPSYEAYDVAGNLERAPTDSAQELSHHVRCVYDAWNRLVRVVDKDGSPVLAEFERDALGRIVREGVSREHYWYSDAWQILCVQNEDSGQNVRVREYVWGPRYVDELVASYVYARNPARRYHVQDTNWNVVWTLAVVDGEMRALEAIRYDPYGVPYFYDPNPNWTGYAYPPNDWESPEETDVAFQGRWYWKLEAPGEGRLRLYDFRHRTYSPKLGRFLQRDPLGVRGNAYGFVGCNPLSRVDPGGLWWSDGTENGHAGMPGQDDCGVDYELEDRGWSAPWIPWSCWRHFRDIDEAEDDLKAAIVNCDVEAHSRYAHQMQDWFAHAGQGFSCWTFGHALDTVLAPIVSNVGHAFGATQPVVGEPDNPFVYEDAFTEAKKRTQAWWNVWRACCCCVDETRGRWEKRERKDGSCQNEIDKVGPYPSPSAPPPKASAPIHATGSAVASAAAAVYGGVSSAATTVYEGVSSGATAAYEGLSSAGTAVYSGVRSALSSIGL